MEVRQMAVAYLFHGDELLLIRKSGSRLHAETYWSGVGGHMEPHELNSPREACLREIYEEAGIQASELIDLKLRYILLRVKEAEIRQQYVYFGRTTGRSVRASDEGELFWVDQEAWPQLTFSTINAFMLAHYRDHVDAEQVFTGTITLEETGQPAMQWAELRDPKVF
ncbi:NUDIX domain-containing protein [Paenibacillus sp. R14(2021)]|uniref:NUDIX domain-containing protein n=1 Tax=Paenibacillus sp. R14(2021) TaxID=2859228 RepID=UPI001C614846|nr:NUDIX domain-containing protein [Paenibacillus sp. R14(2021)]